IYTKDATTLSDWMTNHSGPAASTKVTTYFPGASNRSSVTVDGKPGISLDWFPNEGPGPVHTTATLLGTAYVIVLQWWVADPSYATTLRPYYLQMLASLTT